MNKDDLAAVKAEIEQEERIYLIELNTDQEFEKLMAARLKLNMLNQQILAHEIANLLS